MPDPHNTTGGNTQAPNLLEAAIATSKSGWPVFPCNPLGADIKRPMFKEKIIEHGHLDATHSLTKIKRWWKLWPNAMIGVPMGAVSGVFCIDLDRKEGGGDGLRTWRDWEIEFNDDEQVVTRQHKTPSTGRHLIFRWLPGIGCIRLDALGSGIEIKGEGGYIIVPPSRAVDKIYESNNKEIANAPPWILQKIQEHFARRKRVEDDTRDYNNVDRDEVWMALNAIDDDSYQMWFEIGSALRNTYMNDGYDLFERWSQKSPKFNSSECRHKWDRFANVKEFSIATVFYHADRCDVTWRERWQAKSRPKITLKTVSLFPIDEEKIPVRDWVLPGMLLRKHLTVTAAPPGSGKGLFSMCVAFMLGTQLEWGGWRPRGKYRVLIINTEEDREELMRRAIAAISRMGVRQEQLTNMIEIAENPSSVVISKYDSRTRSMIRQPLVGELMRIIKENKYDVVIADPFAETFEGEETNTELKMVGGTWRDIARQCNCAVWLIHHVKKYAKDLQGDMDAARGGGALVGVARFISTIFTMTTEEAMLYDVPPEDRVHYIRHDDAKVQYGVMSTQARWFKKVTVGLCNGSNGVQGDDVGALEPWQAPALAHQSVGPDKIIHLMNLIDRGIFDPEGNSLGEYYTLKNTTNADSSFNRWVGVIMMKELDINEANARQLIKDLRNHNVLVEFEYKNHNRKLVRGCGSWQLKQQKERPTAAQQELI